MKPAALAAAVLLCPGIAQAADIAFGPLTLAYDAGRWEALAADDGAVLRCIADGCDPTPVEFLVLADDGASCSSDAMYPALTDAFPGATGWGVNPRVIGNLVLYLGFAKYGPLLDHPSAVRACVTHDGASVHITSRVDAGWPTVDHAWETSELLMGLRAAPGERREVAVGALAIGYDSAAWQPYQQVDDGWLLACLPPACDPEAWVSATMRPPGEACPPAEPSEFRDVDAVAVIGRDALVFELQTIRLGCRNLVPLLHSACTMHAGRAYVIETLDEACRTHPEVPIESIQALVEDTGRAGDR